MKKLVVLIALMATFVANSLAQDRRSKVVLNVDLRNYYIHTVSAAEDVADIASLYSITEKELVEENNLDPVAPAIEEGALLRVPCYERTSRMQPKRGDSRFDRHRVIGGESLFKVAVDYAIALDTLIEDNPGLDITNLRGRSSLSVRRSAQGKCQLPEIEQQSRRYAAMLQHLSNEYDYLAIEEGDTFYSLALRVGEDVDKLISLNGNPQLIYIGMTIKVSRKVENNERLSYEVLDDEVGELTDSIVVECEWPEDDSKISPDEPLRVAVMLPLSDTLGRVRGSFVEFWQAAVLAAEELNEEYEERGMKGRVELGLFDTQNSEERVAEIMNDWQMWEWNPSLFIGPVYEKNVDPVDDYKVKRGRDIPIVSPLESTTKGAYGRGYFRMAPTSKSRVDKLSSVVGPETNVIMVYTASYDEDMEREMLDVLGDHPYGKVIYDEAFVVDSLNSRPIEELMAEEDNLFVVLADNEIDTDRSLAIISSMMNSRQPKYGMRRVPIRVVGNSSWAKYKNMDKNLLFKLQVCYLAPYHADRGNERVREFDRKYMAAFGRAPSMFAYRAYDAVRLFAESIYAGGDLVSELNGAVVPLLQTRYSFSYEDGNMVNDSWALVTYLPRYTIEVR